MTSGLKIVDPLPVGDAQLTSSSVPEADYPAWASGTTYTVGQRVIRTQTHSVYERATAGGGTAPPETDAVNWARVGPTNRWAMFDQVNSTLTTASGSLIVEVTPGRVFNALALLNVQADAVRVEVIDPNDGTVYDRTIVANDNTQIGSWWSWFFQPIRRKKTHVLTDLPSYGTAKLRLTLVGTAVAVGTCILGVISEFGEGIEAGASAGIQDFSRKERDAFGNFVLVERSFARTARWQMKVPAAQVDALIDFLAALRAKPALFIGSDLYSATVIYGFFKDFDVVIAYPTFSECSIELEGLT
ncbi:hypothetical protein [Chitinilyticum aquatile]|uniref:hypothetical protein n=1 Tax=Chitinilyticum aquatile TaxID=362520 RepID=UPI000419C093|nr:hypothetical protein [Chitinilyticum aquatile]